LTDIPNYKDSKLQIIDSVIIEFKETLRLLETYDNRGFIKRKIITSQFDSNFANNWIEANHDGNNREGRIVHTVETSQIDPACTISTFS
jgi:hypothetical protein